MRAPQIYLYFRLEAFCLEAEVEAAAGDQESRSLDSHSFA